MKVGVVGAGSWGTTLADMLARNGHQVRIWAREPEVVASINGRKVNDLFLPDAPLADTLRAEGEVAAVVANAEVVVSAAPSHAVRPVSEQIARSLTGRPLVVSVSKGLEPDTLESMTRILATALPGCGVVALSGPSFAQEVYEGHPTAVVAASLDPAAAAAAQRAFSTGRFRVYTSPDVVGVELGGALKNVIAIAAGIVEGLGLGFNTRAALITRGLAEMTRLGVAMGAQALTFAGLAGMGDLVLTATGALSRNRSLGFELGRGRSLDEVLGERRSVAEGVGTARVASRLAERAGAELPIAAEVARILFEGKVPERAIRDLMERDLKAEQWR